MKSNWDWVYPIFIHLFILTFIIAPLSGFSQNLAQGTKTTPNFSDLFNGRPFVPPPSNVIGDINFNEEWRLINATLYSGKKVEGYYGKYNIYFNELDYKTPNGIKSIEGDRINTFTINDSIPRLFVNAKDFKKDNVPLVGFLEVMVAGKMSLFKLHYILVKDPDYSAVLNAGSRDTRIYKKNALLAGIDDKLMEVKGKKKLLLGFDDKASEVDQFIKKNHLSMSEDGDLVKTINFFNNLK